MEEFDVVIIGAGISGICAMHHLNAEAPGCSFVCLERRATFGGTWDLFKYPGIRSDSDMFTFGYNFRPWPSVKTIAPEADILEYLEGTIKDSNLHNHIRYEHHAIHAEWSSINGTWTVCCGNESRFRCKFMVMCTGYYDHDNGYEPEFPGAERFTGAGGLMVHPQKWNTEIEYDDKQVVIIGSGATAVTLIPAMAEKAGHVTMLQRSPTYIMAAKNGDSAAKFLDSWGAPPWVLHPIVRWKKVVETALFGAFLQWRDQEANKKMFIGFMRRFTRGVEGMDDEETFAENFTPKYYPWEQRMCLAPDGDFYRALRHGNASIVTDVIETFDETGILLGSGKHVDADLVITATGLKLQQNYPMATMKVLIDGEEYIAADHFVYKGCMLSNVPNLGFVSGYFNASWTLKADIICTYLARVVNHLSSTNTYCAPRPRCTLEEVNNLTENSPGYVLRSKDLMPKTTENAPWAPLMSYVPDRILLEWFSIEDGTLEFHKVPRASL